MTELNDQTLLTYWYRKRDAEAFRVLATRHAQMVYATALRIVHNREDAEDVSQQSFMTLAQTRRPPRENVAAWLHRTTFNAALNLLRTRKRRDSREMEYANATPVATEATWDDLRELIDEAVSTLPDRYRESVVRFFYEGQTHETIASILGVSRQTVTYRIGKGTELVRKRLSRKGICAPAGMALAHLVQQNANGAPMAPSGVSDIGRIAMTAQPSPWALLPASTSMAGVLVAAAVLVAGMGAWMAPSRPQEGEAVSVPSREAAMASAAGAAAQEGDELPAGDTSIDRAHTSEEGTTISRAAAAGENGDDKEPAWASLSGKVTIPNGRGFAGASIRIKLADRKKTYGFPESTGLLLNADERGAFEVKELAPAEYSISAAEPGNDGWGQAHELTRITLAAGEQKDDLVLVFGTEGDLSVSGTVVDGKGRPIADARVYKFGPAPRSAKTDARGRFTLEYLPDDSIKINTDIPKYRGPSATVQAGDQDVRLIMYRNGAIEGRVVDAKTGKAIPAFEASYNNYHMPVFKASLFDNKQAFEDTDGRFQFPEVNVGNVTLAARAPGYRPSMTQMTMEEAEMLRGVVLKLEASEAKRLTGHVVTAEGLPIVGARLYIGKLPGPHRRVDDTAATSGAAGEFTIENAQEEVTFLSAWHPGFAPSSGKVTESTEIVLRKAGRLHVEVVSEEKAKVRIRTHFPGEQQLGYSGGGTTGPDGTLTIDEILPGEVIVRAILASNRAQQTTLHFEPGEEKTVRFVVPAAEVQVEGTVYSDGAPVSEGRLYLFVETESGAERLEGHVEPDGTFSIRNVPAGEGRLMVTGPEGQHPLVEGIPLVASQLTTVPVDITTRQKIVGVVSGIGAGERGVIMAFRGAFSLDETLIIIRENWMFTEFAGFSIADASGTYEVALHDPGTYTLLFSTCCLENQFNEQTHHEARVVEVRAAEDVAVDFALTHRG